MLNALISLLIDAEGAVETVAEGAEAGAQGQGSPWSSLIMIVLLIGIFYFLMIRPQQKKQKEIKKFREGIKVGDRIITAGGIHGKVSSIKEDTFTITIANDVNIKVDKGSVYPMGTTGTDTPLKENA
ncbi:MAG: preprotein translocase subunit YajC [Clostridiales bacterium]|nr:preprotein translocase subunit YajC [Clostridiales bacterium]